jgi:hypothetical protein
MPSAALLLDEYGSTFAEQHDSSVHKTSGTHLTHFGIFRSVRSESPVTHGVHTAFSKEDVESMIEEIVGLLVSG